MSHHLKCRDIRASTFANQQLVWFVLSISEEPRSHWPHLEQCQSPDCKATMWSWDWKSGATVVLCLVDQCALTSFQIDYTISPSFSVRLFTCCMVSLQMAGIFTATKSQLLVCLFCYSQFSQLLLMGHSFSVSFHWLCSLHCSLVSWY